MDEETAAVTYEDATEEERVAGLGIDMVCTLDDAGGFDEPSRWTVSLKRGRGQYVAPMTLGAAYRRWKKGAKLAARYDGVADTTYRKSIKTGAQVPICASRRGCTAEFKTWFATWTEPEEPTLACVLSCLNSDANCVRYGQDFGDFCSEFGYDTDSRKALQVFEGCRNSWAGLVRLGLDLDDLDRRLEGY